jgi:hypothetical protein
MQANSQSSTPMAKKPFGKIDRVRHKLYSFVESEAENYMRRTDTLFNSKKPAEIQRKYSIIRLKRSHTSKPVNSAIRDSARRSSAGSVEGEKAIFSKCMQEIGKDFIDLRKKVVGVKKMEKFKKLTIDTNLSFVEAFGALSSRRKSTAFRFTHVNMRQQLEDIFMSKDEKEAKHIQDNFNRIQTIVRQFKKAPGKGTTAYTQQGFKDNNINFIKFSEELFDILEFKGIKFDSKVLSENLKRNVRGSYDDVPLRNPFHKAENLPEQLKYKSNSIINVTGVGASLGKNKPFSRNFDFNDNVETNVNTMGNSPLIRFNKRKESDFIDDIIDPETNNYYHELFKSPDYNGGFINYERSGSFIENCSDIEAENRISNLYDESDTPINFKATNCFSDYVNLIRCNRPSIRRCDSAEVSKFSEVTKSDISRTCSLSKESSMLNDSISEVSNDFDIELNNSCSA